MNIDRKLAAAAMAFLLAAPAATAAYAAHRVALVIGNDQYQNLPKLQKPVADARSYAKVLKAKGFDQVILKNDLTRGQLDEALASFLDQLEPGDTAVFAYSGHGWSDGAQNYIVGTDAPGTGSQDFLARISIPLKNGINGIIDEMDQKGAILKVAVIDACRDNPFTPPPGKRSIGLTRGMARIDPPNGTFVVFSAGAGQSALDRLSDSDPDPNSVFTRVFVPAIRADMTLQEAVKTTQEQVVALAKSVQEDQKPAYYDEVIGSACLSARCNSGAAAASSLVLPLASAPAISPPPADDVTWERIATSDDPVDFESFARVFPDSAHRADAEARTKELRQKAELRVATRPQEAVAPAPEIGKEVERAILHEEPFNGARDQTAAVPGTISWSFVTAGANGAEVDAIVDVPGRSLQARLEFQKNGDPSLPASHVINVTFSLPADFTGKGISNVGLLMKKTEQGRGQPLSALTVRVTNGFFLVGLSSIPAEVKKNLALLSQNDWVDLTLDYETGQRATLTLAKGSLGKRAFEQAFVAWKSPFPISAHRG